MKLCLLIILLLALRQTHTKTYNLTYVLSWLGGVCKVLGPQCNQAKYSQWDHQSFTIQELQVDHPTDKYYGPLNKQPFTKDDVKMLMYFFWPPQLKTYGDPYFMWSRSWDKFGHKIFSIFQEEMPNFRQIIKIKNIQAIYFAVAIGQVVKSFKGSRKLKASTFTLKQFARMLDITYRSIHPVCSKDGTLTNIKICRRLEFNSEPRTSRIDQAQIIPRECSSKERQETCKSSTIYLEDWRQDYEITFKDNPFYKYDQRIPYYPLESEVRGGMGRLYSELLVNILDGFLVTCTVVAVSACWIYGIVAYLKRIDKKKQHLIATKSSQLSRQPENVQQPGHYQQPENFQQSEENSLNIMESQPN